MLTLMLLRHGKAEQQRDSDFDRGLTSRGIQDATALGRHIAQLRIVPDLALVSAAKRTEETFDHFVEGLGSSVPARIDEGLYNATASELRERLNTIAPSVGTLMVVGHNPGIMEAATRLARDGDVTDLARMRDRFPPCCLAILSIQAGDWRDARAAGGRLDLLLMPEDIVSGG